MKGLVLAAGYGTRLYPLTRDNPKPLIEVSGKPMIEYVIEKIRETARVDEIYIVHNEKFSDNFRRWADGYKDGGGIRLVNDGSTDDSNKLGAVGDMGFVIEKEGVNDDMAIVAGDNLFDFDTAGFFRFFHEQGNSVALYRVLDIELVRQYSIVELDASGRIISFREKPQNPATNLAAVCLYMFTQKAVMRIFEYLEKGNNPDAPGHYVKWLVENDAVYGMVMEGNWLDIGDFKSLEEANKIFGG